MSPSQPGDVLEGGYRVLEVKDEQAPYRYRVRTAVGSSLEVVEMPMPGLGKRSRRKLERQRRLLSWVRHPHIRLPVDLCPGPRGLLLVHRRGSGELLERRLFRRAPSVSEALRWASELCTLLAHLNEHGVVLGRLSVANLQLDGNGHLEIAGFKLNSALSFEPILPEDAPTNYEAPEGARTERSDVFIAARMTEHLMAWATGLTGETRRRLQEAIARGSHPDPSQRYRDCSAFKSALGAVRFRLRQEAEARARFPWRALGQGFAAAVLLIALGGGLLLGWTRAEHFRNAADWSTLGGAANGQSVWVAGRLEGTPTLRAPLSGITGLGYRSRVEVTSDRDVWSDEDNNYVQRRSTRVVRDLAQLRGASLDGVPVEDGSVPLVGTLVPQPGVPEPPLEVGEKRLSTRGYERVLAPGDEVVARGVITGGRLIPFELHPGSRWHWERLRLQAALPGLALALLALVGLFFVGRSIWRSAVPE